MIVFSEPGNKVELVVAELAWICFVTWFWSVGSFLHALVRPDLRPSLRFFRLALVYPLVYMAFFLLTFDRLTMSPGYFFSVFPFHLLAMYCVFFDFNFVSKSLALAETGEPVSFYDYAATFFLLWLFPIGIWFVQPRINRLYGSSTLGPQSA